MCTVVDITPTLLAMLRVPLGEDMDGRVVEKIFREEFDITSQPAALATHDTPEFFAAQAQARLPDPGEQERLNQLRNLGYIGGDK